MGEQIKFLLDKQLKVFVMDWLQIPALIHVKLKSVMDEFIVEGD